MSIAMMRAGVKSRAVMIAERPTGPAPITAMVSPGRTRPFSTPTSNAVGRMSDRKSTCSSERSSGSL